MPPAGADSKHDMSSNLAARHGASVKNIKVDTNLLQGASRLQRPWVLKDDFVRKSEQLCDDWNQRKTLRPPPYTGSMRRILAGLDIGDAEIDDLPEVIRNRAMHDGVLLTPRPEPDWADWASVARGQASWQRNAGRNLFALNFVLLQGFVIGRFSDALVLAGYTASEQATFIRFAHTAIAIVKWMDTPLNDPTSKARTSINQVRCAHSFSRHRCWKAQKFDKGEGQPLSQYDLGEVLLGFSVVTMSILESEMGWYIPDDEQADLVHLWRVIGYHLGIMDEFNPCVSVKGAWECYVDYMQWTPARYAHVRESTHEMQRACVHAFGKYTGTGVMFWQGVMEILRRVRGYGTMYCRIRSDPALKWWAWRAVDIVSSNAVNGFISRHHVKFICAMENPNVMRRVMWVRSKNAWFLDTILLRIFIFLFALLHSRPFIWLWGGCKQEPREHSVFGTTLSPRLPHRTWAQRLEDPVTPQVDSVSVVPETDRHRPSPTALEFKPSKP